MPSNWKGFSVLPNRIDLGDDGQLTTDWDIVLCRLYRFNSV